MSTTDTTGQDFTFQAEITKLLHLLSHSLYQNRDVAVRELISNASDALDKMRYVSLTDEAHREPGPLEVRLEADDENHKLTIADTGIGMTREELIENLGTIARSGSLEFLSKLSGDEAKDLGLIGKFGVGFYSAFMLADRVAVTTRSYKEETGWRWESDGTGSFHIEPLEDPRDRGTSVTLVLKEDCHEYGNKDRLREIVRKHSIFLPHPLKLGDERLNDVRPIWVEPPAQVQAEQHKGFYQHLSHRTMEEPRWTIHFSVDLPIQFHALLYCPQTNFEKLGFGRDEHGIQLCARRVLVQHECRELLPEYLRFLYGIVDSEDLPLNVSRQALQDDTVFAKIRSMLVKKVFDRLDGLAKEDADSYLEFHDQFGMVLREGIASDFANRTRIAKLLRFHSSAVDEGKGYTSLDEYLERAGEPAKAIYYLSGPDISALRNGPNFEIFRKRSIEVLFLTDPVDEYVLSMLGEYEGKKIESADSADLDLPEAAETQEEEAEREIPSGFERVVSLFQEALGQQVKEVRASHRLVDSAACLVQAEGGMSAQMQKLLRMTNQDMPPVPRILEINPRAELIRRLSILSGNPQNDDFVRQCGQQLFSNALLLDGMAEDPQAFVGRVQSFMQEAAEKRSSIIV